MGESIYFHIYHRLQPEKVVQVLVLLKLTH